MTNPEVKASILAMRDNNHSEQIFKECEDE